MCFTSDVSDFLNSKDNFKENHVLSVPIESSSVSFTEIRCSVESMSVELYFVKIQSDANKLIAKSDMKFTCSVSPRSDKPLSLDILFSCLTLSSMLNSVVLLECTSCTKKVPILNMKLLMSDEGENHLRFSLPCVNISEPVSCVDTAENSPQSISVSSFLSPEDRFSLTVKSDHNGIKICVPVQVSGEAFKYFGVPQICEQNSFNYRCAFSPECM